MSTADHASSMRALLAGAIDYAGLFPPAALAMSPAVESFAKYRHGRHAWALGRFIVPASQLGEFSAAFAKKFGRITVATIPSAGMSADRKRASKFTMPDTGRLVDFSAYLDGLGGASGSQQIQVVVYRDNNGVPGAKVAASSTRSIADGEPAGWKGFPVANLPLLTPGSYWIAIHTGGAPQVLRNFGDGSPNWYGNDDVFADGASDPFGAGDTGTVTLSVHAKYVVGE